MINLNSWLNKNVKPTETENTYTPPKRLKVEKTVYPKGEPTYSPNGTGEWYGLVDNLKSKV
jgi:hypothetical protein